MTKISVMPRHVVAGIKIIRKIGNLPLEQRLKEEILCDLHHTINESKQAGLEDAIILMNHLIDGAKTTPGGNAASAYQVQLLEIARDALESLSAKNEKTDIELEEKNRAEMQMRYGNTSSEKQSGFGRLFGMWRKKRSS